MSGLQSTESLLTSPATLGMSIALITATQLRISGAPLGAGELLLVAWCGTNLLRTLRTRGGADQCLWTLYWLVSFAALALGALNALAHDVFRIEGMRDVLAYMLVAALCFSCIRRKDPHDTVIRAARTYAMIAALGYLGLLVLATAGRNSFGSIDTWYGFRFRGLAENPNQLALAMLAVPVIALEWLHAAERPGKRVLAISTLFAGVVVGIASLSNALMLAWSVGSVLLVPGVIGWLRRVGLRTPWGLVRQIGLPLALLATLGVSAFNFRTTIRSAGQAAFDAGGEGDDRVARWRNGLAAIEQSPIVGFGPGSFSGPTRPFQQEEAHNTAIDWTMSAGVVGLLALLSLLGIGAWRSRHSAVRLAFMVSIVAFAGFHFTLRQPVFWLLVLVLLTAPPDAAVPVTTRTRVA